MLPPKTEPLYPEHEREALRGTEQFDYDRMCICSKWSRATNCPIHGDAPTEDE